MRKNEQKINKKALNEEVNPIPKKDLQNSVVEIKFLANSWLDDFEKKIFNGKTINQVLNPNKYE